MLWFVVLGCTKPSPPTVSRHDELSEIDRISAFARLYGWVRWFHPSDAVTQVDWDRVATVGAVRAREANDRDALRDVLEQTLGVLGPIQIWVGPDAPLPLNPGDGPPMTWNHLGSGENNFQYASWRAGADEPWSGRSLWDRGTLTYALDTRDPVAFSAWLRVAEGTLRVRLGEALTEVRSTEWTRVELVGAGPAVELELEGDGPAWLDEVVITQSGRTLADLDVSADGWNPSGVLWGDLPVGRDGGWATYLAQRVHLGDEVEPIVHPLGTVHEGELGGGLHARVPISLPVGTAGALPDLAGGAEDVELGRTLVAWSAMRHFFPCARESRIDWDALLTEAIEAATAPGHEDDAGVWVVLRALRDGHVYHPRSDVGGFAPVHLAWIEEQVVVVESFVDWSQRGDVVVGVDGTPVAAVHAERVAHASGAPHFLAAIAASEVARGKRGETVDVELDRSGTAVTGEWTYGAYRRVPDGEPIRVLDGIWVVDLGADGLETPLDWEALAAAKGVVFDIRGYVPTSVSTDVLRHLLAAPERARWMHVPHRTLPAPHEATFVDAGWDIDPVEPRVTGRIAWLTGGVSSISATESLGLYVEAHELGPRFGGPTVGANGNVADTVLPGGT
ncbi:MAG: hypothetical protein KC656_24865, partial [Myxococcales bacterium]|nr:hypothetical protein [Myxococcales bacterium]